MSGPWKESFSEKNQKKYWKNMETGETTWKDPTGGTGTADAGKADKKKSSKAAESSTDASAEKKPEKKSKTSKDASAAGDSAESSAASDWVQGFSEKKQAPYWKNKVTGESTWKDPTGSGVSAAAKGDDASTKSAKSKANTEVSTASEWTEHFSEKHQKKYWKNATTGKSTFTDPHAGKAAEATSTETTKTSGESSYNPDEWEEKFDKKREKKYWKNKITGKATYNDPAKEAKKADTASVASASTGAAAAEGGGGSSEWDKKFSEKHQKPYWKNKSTGATSWTDPTVGEAATAAPAAAASAPAAVSDVWEEKFDKKSNRKYWKNKETGKSTFKDPTTATAATAASSAAKKGDEMSVVSGTSTVATASRASEWVEKFSEKHGKKYWKNSVDGRTSWTPPPASETAAAPAATAASAGGGGAEEWVESYSEKHKRACWKNTVTGKTTYTKPPGWTGSASGTTAARSAPSADGPVRAVARFAWSTAVLESDLESPLHQQPLRCLLHLRGKQQTTELEVLRFKDEYQRARRAGDAAAIAAAAGSEHGTEVVRTFKLSSIRSLICNEVQGVLSLILPAGCTVESVVQTATAAPTGTAAGASASVSAAPAGPVAMVLTGEDGAPAAAADAQTAEAPAQAPAAAPAVEEAPAKCAAIALHLGSPAMALAWYNVLVKRLDLTETIAAGNAAPAAGVPLVLNKTGVEVTALSDAENALLGTHSLACADPLLMAMETEWLCHAAPAADSAQLSALANKILAQRSVTQSSVEAAAPLPSSGLLLFKVLAVHEFPEGEGATCSPEMNSLDSTSAQMKGWMSCWVRIDRSTKGITFYDQGPGSAPSLAVTCEAAVLHVPDLTDPELGCECNLYHCTVRNSLVRAKMSIAIKLPSAVELFRWVLTLSGLVETVTYCSSGMVQSATQPIDYLQDSPQTAMTASTTISAAIGFNPTQPFLAETCLGVLESLAERKMCSSYLRHVQLNGAQIKTARFLQINQRIVLLIKGNCTALTEGSVLLSVNGLSTVTTPASTILKFIADFPRQMQGELSMWKFPRMEFAVQVVKLTVSAADLEGADKLAEKATRAADDGNATAEEARPLDSKGKLNKVIIQKRNSILKISSGMDMSYEGIAHPSIIADLQKELKALDVNTAPAATAAAAAGEDGAGFTLADFLRTAPAEVKWQHARLMVASGNVSILVTDAAGTEVSLARLQLSTCQMKLVCPTHGAAVTHLAVHLRDAKNHVVVQCGSLEMLVDLVECLLIALKMMGAYAADLAHLYDQSVHWSNAAQQRAAADASVPTRSQSLLMQTVLERAEESRDTEAPSTPTRVGDAGKTAPTAATPAAAITEANILQAAEALEATLSSLHLPTNFPTHTMLEKEMVELFKANNANHRLLAEFLTLQFEVQNPVPETAVPASRQKSIILAAGAALEEESVGPETKYPSLAGGHGSEGVEDKSADGQALRDAEKNLRDKLVAALGAGGPSDEETRANEAIDKAAAAAAERVGSMDETEAAMAKASPPSPRDTPTTTRRASVQMRSGSVMVSSATAAMTVQSTANRRATFRKSAITHSQEQAAVLLMSQMEKQIMLQSVLNKADRSAISVLLNHLRNSAQDLINIALRFTSPTDVKGLAHFVVHRLCVYWSADQRHLEDIVFTAATAEAPQRGHNVTEVLSAVGDTRSGVLFSPTASLLTRVNGSPVSSGGSFLQALLTEVAGRLDVVVYVQSLCGDISVESLTEDSGVADLCARVVEPFCRRFEAAVVAGTMPIVLKHTLRALVRCTVSAVKPLDFIADCILPHILNAIVEQNKIAETTLGACLSDEQVVTILDRVRDMVNMCFNQGVAKHFKVCLSDQAALSRSKWFIERSLQCIVQDSSTAGPTATTNAPTSSPIARLARIEASSGKTSAIHGLICVRPSELFFILQSMELSNISAAPLSAYSRELSQAITHMHTSDLLQRLHSELRLTPVTTSTTTSTSAATTSAADDGFGSGTGILDALKESGVPFLDREVTFLLHISPHAVYHNEFMHHFNDDSTVPVPALPVKGLSVPGSHGGAGHGGSFNSNADVDLSALVTSESVEESAEAHALASIRWLVQAARSALKATYEHSTASVSKNQSAVRELQELRSKLLSRRDEIVAILADWKKLSTCMELCSNFKAQISLLLEKYRYHKRVAQQASQSPLYWNSSGVSATLSASDPAPSTAALLEATANMTAAGIAKDAEVQAALSKIVLLQLKLEGELQHMSFAYSRSAYGAAESTPTAAAGTRSASKLAALAASSPLRSADTTKQSPQSASRSAWNIDDFAGGMLRSRAPNPLHVVMQSVFATANASRK